MAWEILTGFVKNATAAGVSRQEIRKELESAGWEGKQVDSALNAYSDSSLPIAVPRPAISPTARELFLYLMLFSSLHVAIFGLGTILYQLINLAFPDPADFYSYAYFSMISDVEAKLRSGLASLVVFLPAYLFIDHKIEVLKRSDPGQGGSRVRRKLTYLMLYLTVTILMFDASTLVSFWLSGELDQRVLLKCLVVAGLGAWVLARYLHEMAADTHFGAEPTPSWRLVSLGVFVLVSLAAMIGAARNIEPPGVERKRQADEARVTGLSQIDRSIMTYYRAYGSLPESLEEVATAEHVRFPRDPETRDHYRYERKSETDYVLCANFRLEQTAEDLLMTTSPYNISYAGPTFSVHAAGEHCFDLVVREGEF